MDTIAQIKTKIGNAYIAQEDVQVKYSLTSEDVALGFDALFSKVSIENLLFYAQAFGIWVLLNLFENHKTEVAEIVAEVKPKRRYVDMAKAFQYGYEWLETGSFDNTGKTDDEISASKIVEYAAVVEGDNYIMMKVAKIANNDLASLSDAEFNAFKAYMNLVKDTGLSIQYFTGDAEQLKLVIDIYYNPLLLNNDGTRVDGTNDTPVFSAISEYLQNVDFDGTVVLAYLTDMLQTVSGVIIPDIKEAYYKYGLLDWEQFQVLRQPSSGYMRVLEANVTINYIPRSVL